MKPSDHLLQILALAEEGPSAATPPNAIWEQQALAKFEKLQEDIPDVLAGTEFLSLGSHGMVVAHNDGTISKIFLRNEDDQAWAETLYHDEIRILRRLNGATFGSAHTPSLISETALPDSQEVFASYRMTRCLGREINWNDFVTAATPQDVERHFRNVGEVLAHFHRDAEPMIGDIIPLAKRLDSGTAIDPIPGASEKTNKALSICNDHLQSHMESGVNHNDFHSLNFKANDKYLITGLFDLSFAGRSKNRLIDFASIPDAGMPFAIAEYNAAGGKPVDPTMITLTRISQDVARINWHRQNANSSPEIARARLQHLRDALNSVAHLTGLTFDENETAIPAQPDASPGTAAKPRLRPKFA